MKKAGLLLILISLLVLIIAPTVAAWDDCPKGKSCTYPGKCSRYVDTNGDGICDHGQEEPVAVIASENTETDVKLNSSSTISMEVSDQSDSIADLNAIEVQPSQQAISSNILSSTSPKGYHEIYHMTQITLILTFLYAISHILCKMGILRVVTHRKIWNIALLASFFASLILGVILIINVNFGTHITLPFDILQWHVETGIAMGVISVFHIIWHWNYFKKMIKSLASTA